VRESPEAARARVGRDYLVSQIAGLKDLLAKAERGELVTAGQIAVGVEEGVATELLNAPLPQEQTIGGHVRIRIESVTPYFRGSRAALLVRAKAMSDALPRQFADLELGGEFSEMTLVGGRLSARVHVAHFAIVKASVGPLAQGALESLIRENLPGIEGEIPPLEIPVRLDQEIRIGSFEEGPVAAKGGSLPLVAKVSLVLASNERLWVLIDASVGPWKVAESPAPESSP
jgi:hypothetical protein